MARKDVLLQRGLHTQQLSSGAATASNGVTSTGQLSREVDQYRESCPPGTADEQIERLIQQVRGDEQRMQNAISEMWEDYRGGDQDEWATVKTKRGKRKDAAAAAAQDDIQRNGRGRGHHGGRGGYSTRGGFSHGRGRGRSAPPGGRGGGSFRGGRGGRGGDYLGQRHGNTSRSESIGPQSHVSTDKQTLQAPVDLPVSGAWGSGAKVSWGDDSENLTPSGDTEWESLEEPQLPSGSGVIGGGWSAPAQIGDSTTTTKATDNATAPIQNAWARGSPVIKKGMEKAEVLTSNADSEAKVTGTKTTKQQPKIQQQSASKEAPKKHLREPVPDILEQAQVSDHHHQHDASSPKQLLNMGKWDSPATSDLSLQFGSFSLDGGQSVDTANVGSWGSNVRSTWGSPSNGDHASKKEVAQAESSTTFVSTSTTDSNSELSSPSGFNAGPPGLTTIGGTTIPSSKVKHAHEIEAAVGSSANAVVKSPKSEPQKPEADVNNSAYQQQGISTQAAKLNPPYGYQLGSGDTASLPGQYKQQYHNQYGPMGLTDGTVQESTSTPSCSKSPRPPTSQPSSTSQQQPLTSTPSGVSKTGQPQQPQSHQQHPHQQHAPHGYQQQQPQYGHSPPPPPGMAVPFNPYNYGYYQQNYGYYQNPQYPGYNPRQQYPPRGNVPYSHNASMGFSNPSIPLGYQDAHGCGNVHQGFGDLGYLQQPPQPHQAGSSSQPQSTTGSTSLATSSTTNVTSASPSSAPYNNGYGGNYQNQPLRPGAGNPASGSSSSSGGTHHQHQHHHQQQQHHHHQQQQQQHHGQYGWSGSYGQAGHGGWGHQRGPYQQPPSQTHPQPRQYQRYGGSTGNSGSSAGASSSDSQSGANWSS